MRRSLILLAMLAALTGWLAVHPLLGQSDRVPGTPLAWDLATPAPQPVASASAAPAADLVSFLPVAAACTPSPLCPASCDADCKSRGARFGFCSAEKCCYCIWKI